MREEGRKKLKVESRKVKTKEKEVFEKKVVIFCESEEKKIWLQGE